MLTAFSDFGGFMDMQGVVRQMNALTPSASAAQVMQQKGLDALDRADGIGLTQNQTTRDNIRAHLNYYDSSNYASGFYDIRDYTQRAFIEYNAAVEGDLRQSGYASAFWSDVASGFQALPGQIGQVLGEVGAGAGQVIGQTAGGILKGLIGNPVGAVVLIGIGWLALKYTGTGKRLTATVRRLAS